MSPVQREAVADAEMKQQEQVTAEYQDKVTRLKTALGEQAQMCVTHRLMYSPACLVAGAHDLGAHFERLLKAAGQKVTPSRPVLEINPEHALVQRLRDESDAQRFGDWARILFDQALLSEGGQLDDPAGFVARVNQMWLGLLK